MPGGIREKASAPLTPGLPPVPPGGATYGLEASNDGRTPFAPLAVTLPLVTPAPPLPDADLTPAVPAVPAADAPPFPPLAPLTASIIPSWPVTDANPPMPPLPPVVADPTDPPRPAAAATSALVQPGTETKVDPGEPALELLGAPAPLIPTATLRASGMRKRGQTP